MVESEACNVRTPYAVGLDLRQNAEPLRVQIRFFDKEQRESSRPARRLGACEQRNCLATACVADQPLLARQGVAAGRRDGRHFVCEYVRSMLSLSKRDRHRSAAFEQFGEAMLLFF